MEQVGCFSLPLPLPSSLSLKSINYKNTPSGPRGRSCEPRGQPAFSACALGMSSARPLPSKAFSRGRSVLFLWDFLGPQCHMPAPSESPRPPPSLCPLEPSPGLSHRLGGAGRRRRLAALSPVQMGLLCPAGPKRAGCGGGWATERPTDSGTGCSSLSACPPQRESFKGHPQE